jgi:DNA-binding beta-propeller fold protein YncE
MKRNMWVFLVLFALVTAAFAQTKNSKYEVTFFGAPPPGQDVWSLPRAIAVDGKGKVIVFRAFQPPILEFNRAGELKKTWGEGVFVDAHSIDFDRDGFLWMTDRKHQMVYKYTADGKQVMTLGKDGVAGDNTSHDAFNAPTDVAIAANGDIFVSDGHVNSRVVHFSKDGKFIGIIGGTKGPGPGQFEVPHSLVIDSKGRVLVLDQQQTANNARVQVFDQSGKFLEQWTGLGLHQPTGIAIAADDTVYIGDTDRNAVFVVKEGKLIDKIGSLQARPHHIAIDPASGIIYIADPVTLEEAGGLSPVKRKLDPVTQDAGNPIDGGLVKQIIPKKSKS